MYTITCPKCEKTIQRGYAICPFCKKKIEIVTESEVDIVPQVEIVVEANSESHNEVQAELAVECEIEPVAALMTHIDSEGNDETKLDSKTDITSNQEEQTPPRNRAKKKKKSEFKFPTIKKPTSMLLPITIVLFILSSCIGYYLNYK